MWEKINKVQAQVIACMIIIVGCFALALYAAVNGLDKTSEVLVNKVTDISLMGAIAWLFTMSKNGHNNQKPAQ